MPSFAINFFSSFKAFLIFDFATDVTTNLSQSFLGFCLFDVIISTWSPLLSWLLSATNLPLTFAPMHLSPISVCISNAKSRAVELFGKVLSSPAGVKTYISPVYKLSLKSSMKSIALEFGFSRSSLTFLIQLSMELSLLSFSLYFQCAA